MGWSVVLQTFNKCYVSLSNNFIFLINKQCLQETCILLKIHAAMWLIAEDLFWGPEWDMWILNGYTSWLELPYDNMGTHLCFGEFPDQKWKNNWLERFCDTYICEEWHTYGFEWTDTEAKWFVDGELVHELSIEQLGDNTDLWPNEEMYMYLNNGAFTAAPDETTVWPNYVKLDYVRLYKKT